MAVSQSDSIAFSVRIVSIDSYMAPPIPDLDTCYSSFQGGKINEVPVIRVYGSTPAGQRACLHIHRVLPYFYVPCVDISIPSHLEGDAYLRAISHAIEKALKLRNNAGLKRQHVHGCSLVRAKKFYGYHSTEELFVKIYLYYPQDVSRAANLLLGGAVLDKSLQPHESHIPFILQFLIDYNLYGMGHLHVSKLKFRHPVPDIFSPRRANCSDEYTESINFQADSNGDACLSPPIWISSTIPGGWLWPGELDTSSTQGFHLTRRQSTCELEGDASVDEILNQQFKMYSSLSQTRSDVKMVPSLVPIWEEEYERTGMHERVMHPDPDKPLPKDVLKTLLHGLEFEKKFTELCCEAGNFSTPFEKDVRSVHSIKYSTDRELLAELGDFKPHSNGEKPFECSNARNQIESKLSQGMPCEEDLGALPCEEDSPCPKLLSVDEPLTCDISETMCVKAADQEALGLLRWFASSQAAEDINSDDVLVHETILSPLLPATTLDKVLEKANMDYENESQHECQDILDSIDGLIDFEGLKERASYSSNRSHSASDKIIPQVDGSGDDCCRSLAGGSFETYSESKRPSQQQLLEVAGTSCTTKNLSNKPLWGSLSCLMTQNVNDTVQPGIFDITGACGTKSSLGSGSWARKETGKNSDVSLNNGFTDVCDMKETSSLVECSVRDLMRKKRYHRFELPECGTCSVKKVLLEPKQKEDTILCPQPLVIQKTPAHEQDMQSLKSPFLSSQFTEQQAEFFETSPCEEACALVEGDGACDAKPMFPKRSMPDKLCLASCIASSIQDHTLKDEHFGSCERFDDKASIGALAGSGRLSDSSGSQTRARESPLLLNSVNQGSAVPRGHSKDHSFKFIDFGLTPTEPVISDICTCKPDPMVNVQLQMFENEATEKDLIGVTLSENPPTLDLANGSSKNALQPPNMRSWSLYGNNEICEGTSVQGRGADEYLPFFAGNQKERDDQYKLFESDDHNFYKVVMGEPAHIQNDGSFLYLLTPIFSPPSRDSVSMWLSNDDPGFSSGLACSKGSLIDSSNMVSSESCRKSLVKPILNHPNHENPQNLSESGPNSHVKPILNHQNPGNPQYLNTKMNPGNEATPLQSGINFIKVEKYSDFSVDISQISGPDRKSKPTPVSQTGFRDPASIGGGQQLTLLSIEVQAESRGDLRPDPRFDAINVIAIAIQEDNDCNIEDYILMRSNIESCQRNLDGISGCKVLVFSEEKHLFNHLMKIICSFDPDILMGWDIQCGSLGFLAERASRLGIGLLNNLSRVPSEIKMPPGDAEISNIGMQDDVLPESLTADSISLEDAIIEDEWGRTHASGVHVGGRIVLNIWRLMRSEVKLSIYSVEAVADSVLCRKVPSINHRVLTKWYSSGPGQARYRCIEYIMGRAKLNLEIMNQLDMINRTSELARVFGIDFFSVLSRGSQYRVESMFLRLAHTQNYLAISPGSLQVAYQPAMECLPLVMEPESGFYADPVVVLDFQALYPSMIIAYNLCFCTCLGKVVPSKANTLGVSLYSPDPHVLQNLQQQILLTPNGVMYVPPEVRKGILPHLLEEVLSTRIMVKQAMKKLAPCQKVLSRIFNARQLALKLISNVTYGYTAAGFSGRMPCAELADSIVQCGRRTLENAISFVNAHAKWKARVIYGDTDSMFVLLKGRTVKESFQIGNEIASAITEMNPYPVTLKMEKVYHPCFLLAKKRYVGYSYESPDHIEPVFDAKGIETVRRDTCVAVAKTMEQSLRLFFEHQNLSKVKAYLQRQWTRILSGRVSVQDFIFAKEVRLGTYSTRSSSLLPPAAIVATKAMRTDPRAEPRYAERIPYVVIHGEPGARLVDMVVDPLELIAIDSPFRLNDLYYINKQIIPALQRAFGLVGANLNLWFLEMPRAVRQSFAKRRSYAPNNHRTRIDYYYLSKHCILCGELVQASANLCEGCSKRGIAVATALTARTSKLEREMQHLAAICRHCGGGDWLVESGLKCTSLACSVFFERQKVQKDLQALSAIATEAGFYPRCMIEWF